MKGWTNYHSHTHYCDGKGSVTDYLGEACNQGMLSYGFSSHAPTPFSWPWTMKMESLEDYLFEVESGKAKYLGMIEVYTGLEVDFIPGVVSVLSPWIDQADLDYTIGSVHFVDSFEDGTPWEIDGTHKIFLDGLSAVFKNDCKAAVRRYFSLTRQMIEEAPPTIVGHLDKIKMQNIDGKYFSEDEKWYQEEILQTLELIRDTGLFLEINTRGLYKKKCTTCYPSPATFGHIRQMNIPVMLNSDSHVPGEMTGLFSETANLLLSHGINKAHVLSRDQWQEVKLSCDGFEI